MSTVIITGSATLRVLNVSLNDIGDDGMAVISEALQHNKSLTILKVAKCVCCNGCKFLFSLYYVINHVCYDESHM